MPVFIARCAMQVNLNDIQSTLILYFDFNSIYSTIVVFRLQGTNRSGEININMKAWAHWMPYGRMVNRSVTLCCQINIKMAWNISDAIWTNGQWKCYFMLSKKHSRWHNVLSLTIVLPPAYMFKCNQKTEHKYQSYTPDTRHYNQLIVSFCFQDASWM